MKNILEIYLRRALFGRPKIYEHGNDFYRLQNVCTAITHLR